MYVAGDVILDAELGDLAPLIETFKTINAVAHSLPERCKGTAPIRPHHNRGRELTYDMESAGDWLFAQHKS